jgi:hypothetical protein
VKLGDVMKRAILALALLAGAPVVMGQVALPERGLWVGFEATPDGFWLDTQTGQTWMTGVCLRQIADSQSDGVVWTSVNRTVETIGRLSVPLEQTFVLILADQSDEARAEIRVNNPDRGGERSFPAVVRRCDRGASCSELRAQPVC